MRCLARDLVALEHLICAQPIAVGAEEYEVCCAEHEQVVMCPAWSVAGTLGPGRHRWRSPEPQFPATAYFVRTTPVAVAFAMSTTVALASGGEPVHVHANGSLQARCRDVDLLIAQLVGLPSDSLNDEILRSVARSVERHLARLLTHRAITGGLSAVTDPAALQPLLQGLAALDLAAGAVRGIEVVRVEQLAVSADSVLPQASTRTQVSFGARTERLQVSAVTSDQSLSAHGEIVVHPPMPAEPTTSPGIGSVGMSRNAILAIGTSHIGAGPADESGPPTPIDRGGGARYREEKKPDHTASGLSPGTRVLVPSPTGLMQSATVRQMQRGHYELEVGGSGETIWVPVSGVVPE